MKRAKLPRNHIQPTVAQIKVNIIVVPRSYINENRHLLRWFHTFSVVVNGVKREGRHLDLENRIGGIALSRNIEPGSVLRMTIADNTLFLTTVEGDWPAREDASPTE